MSSGGVYSYAMPHDVVDFKGQNYEQLKANLLGERRVFEDPTFPASDASIRLKKPLGGGRIVWKRPWEICRDPCFIRDGVNAADIDQGALGDCWFISATACLATDDQRLFYNVVQPKGQSFAPHEYAGIFHYRFWRFGQWKDVIIDDRLPTMYGKLVFAHNVTEPNEFWGALMEKAYAKVNGSYGNIEGGKIQDALVDFTGGISEVYNLTDKQNLPKDLFRIIQKSVKAKSMQGASISASQREREASLTNGLFKGHAYSVIDVRQIRTLDGRSHNLMQLRNPWGHGEWNGDWSDKSPVWNQVSDSEKRGIDFARADDGVFWMSFEDWLANYTEFQICHLSPDSLTSDSAKTKWQCVRHDGEWVHGVSAGGSGNPPYQTLYWSNPQYSVHLQDANKDDDSDDCTMIISLMERDNRANSVATAMDIYKLKQGMPVLLTGENYEKKALRYLKNTGSYSFYREVTMRFVTDPGVYVIVPSTFKPGEEKKFMFRIFTEKPISSAEVDTPTGPISSTNPQQDVLKKAFDTYAGQDGAIDAKELRHVLKAVFHGSADVAEEDFFDIETCRALIAMMDDNKSGLMDYDEFRKMLAEMKTWKEKFDKYDKDQSNSIDANELRSVFNSIGFNISRKVLLPIVRRYGGKQHALSFQDFVVAMTKVMSMYKAFSKYTKKGEPNIARVTLEEWLVESIYS
ncbi:calpain-8-like [Lineus longissimus]|uniref:calpain-8-like n=1 Tax=Lineus longissimus TaxID=88925 RepID=UPI002B4C647B